MFHPTTTRKYTLEELERRLLTAARVVELYGDKNPDYVLIFLRMEREVKERRQHRSALLRAQEIAACSNIAARSDSAAPTP